MDTNNLEVTTGLLAFSRISHSVAVKGVLLKEDRCRVGACVPYAMLFLTPFLLFAKK